MPHVSAEADPQMSRRASEDALGRDILDECRVQLMLKFRFLDLALWRMELEPMRVGAAYPLSTDAARVLYDPARVIARFRESFDESVRDYLHLVMHCVFRHPFNEDHDNREAWNLTCDIIVESAVMDMCGKRFESADDPLRRQALSEIRMLAGDLLPGKVYSLVKGMVQTPGGQQFRGLGRSVLNEWHDLFERDDHGAWPANRSAQLSGDAEPQPQETSLDEESADELSDVLFDEVGEARSGQDASGLPDEHDASDSDKDEQARGEADALDADEDADADDAGGADEMIAADDEADSDSDPGSDEPQRSFAHLPAPEPAPDQERDAEQENEQKAWEDIAKQIEMNLETFSREWGKEAGTLAANLAVANRKKHDYTEFLRQFMIVNEEMQLNMDEFDYIYYSYGVELYGNMPLIEPLEYKETERIRDFAIVIDTSESVSGPLVKKFLSHTFSMLKSSESYASKVSIHVIQCDSRVQSDMLIEDLRDVDRMMEGFYVRGFGGTDFRPAFDYVTRLRKRGELTDMKGLIYFTDGLGTFPEKAPDYDVAFVFMDDEGRPSPPVPPWAMKVVLDETSWKEGRI